MERKTLSRPAEEILTKTLNVSIFLPLREEFRKAAIREDTTATGLPALYIICFPLYKILHSLYFA